MRPQLDAANTGRRRQLRLPACPVAPEEEILNHGWDRADWPAAASRLAEATL
jgi:hypothetical protein